jgi:hypothetical protein
LGGGLSADGVSKSSEKTEWESAPKETRASAAESRRINSFMRPLRLFQPFYLSSDIGKMLGSYLALNQRLSIWN